MKYLQKIFEQSIEKWSLLKIEELYDDLDKMASLIIDYLVIKNFVELKKGRTKYNYHLDEFWFDAEDDDFFAVMYKELYGGGITQYSQKGHNFDYHFTKQQFEDLLVFMNDPEIYKNAGKYNV